jgi:Ni/Co efflux regulator RcnB
MKSLKWTGLLTIAMVMTVGITSGAAAADRDRHDRNDHRDRREGHDRKDDRRDNNHGKSKGVEAVFSLLLNNLSNQRTVTRTWVPGHYEERTERVLVEAGHYENHYIPAVYERRTDRRGRSFTVLVQPERTERVWVPERYEMRTVRYWIEGYWVESSQSCAKPGLNLRFKF